MTSHIMTRSTLSRVWYLSQSLVLFLLSSLVFVLLCDGFQVKLSKSESTSTHHVLRDVSKHNQKDVPKASNAAATLRSISFRGLDNAQQPALLCDLLLELGACSTSIVDSNRDTEDETPIYGDPDPKPLEKDAAMIMEDLAAGKNVWQRCTVDAHFPSSVDLNFVVPLAMETLGIDDLKDYHVTEVPNRDWVVHVQKRWNPIVVEGIVLKFPWHDEEHVQAALQAAEHHDNPTAIIELEGGIAFGTGEHPTTQMCLKFVQSVLHHLSLNSSSSGSNNGISIVDYGSGSGVLGLAACAMNPKVSAVGIEIDADAVLIANANAVKNQLKMKNYLPPLSEYEDDNDSVASTTTAATTTTTTTKHDDESKSILMRSLASQTQSNNNDNNEDDDNGFFDSVQVLPDRLQGPIHDACVSNILAGPLVTLAPTIAGLVKPGAPLGLSGILSPQADKVIVAYDTYFDNVRVQMEQKGWVLITGVRNNKAL